jgi:hypothetical protein
MRFKNPSLCMMLAAAVFLAAIPAGAADYWVTGTATMSTSAASAPAICKQNSGVSRDGTLSNLTKSKCQAHATCTSAKNLATGNLKTYLEANGMGACTKYMSSTAPCTKNC